MWVGVGIGTNKELGDTSLLLLYFLKTETWVSCFQDHPTSSYNVEKGEGSYGYVKGKLMSGTFCSCLKYMLKSFSILYSTRVHSVTFDTVSRF